MKKNKTPNKTSIYILLLVMLTLGIIIIPVFLGLNNINAKNEYSWDYTPKQKKELTESHLASLYVTGRIPAVDDSYMSKIYPRSLKDYADNYHYMDKVNEIISRVDPDNKLCDYFPDLNSSDIISISERSDIISPDNSPVALKYVYISFFNNNNYDKELNILFEYKTSLLISFSYTDYSNSNSNYKRDIELFNSFSNNYYNKYLGFSKNCVYNSKNYIWEKGFIALSYGLSNSSYNRTESDINTY